MGLDSHELAWAAGFFDGEGNIRAKYNAARSGKSEKQYRALSCSVGQRDPAALERFRMALGGVGRIYGPLSNRSQSPMYRWEVGSKVDVHAVCWLLWRWLGTVKREQFHSAFSAYALMTPVSQKVGV